VDAQLYVDNLRTLLKTKRKSTKAQNGYELRQKLIRFAMGRGYDFDIIRQAMEEEEDE
jgi:regulatory protein